MFRPPTAIGALYGAFAVAFTLAVGAMLLFQGLTMEVGLGQMAPLIAGSVFLALAALFAYWTWSCQSLSYVVDRNALAIQWGGLRQIIPIGSIERLIPAAQDEAVDIQGVNWVGHHIGRAQVEDFGEVLFYSNHRSIDEVLYVYTPEQTYAISVPDPVFFAQTVQSNQSRGPLFEQRRAVHRWGLAAQSFGQDRQALLLAGILFVAFFVVLGYVLDTYPGLSQNVPLRFPSFGGIVRVTDKSALLDIPRSAAGFLALNLGLAVVLHSWERMVGYVLLLAGIAIQLVLLVAAIVAVA